MSMMIDKKSSFKDKYNPKVPSSDVTTPTNLLVLHMLGMVFMCYMDVNRNWVLPIALVWTMHLRFFQWRAEKYRNLSLIVCTIAAVMNFSRISFLVALICLASDQEKAPRKIIQSVRELAEWIDITYLPLINPIMGTNSQEFFERVREWVEINLDVSFTFFSVETNRLRDIGINEAAIDITDRETLAAGSEINRVITLATQYRPAFVALTGILAFNMLGVFGILVFVGHVVTYFMTTQTEPRQLLNGTKYVMRDGVYKIQIKLCGLTISTGIGVSTNGVLHVPYHVSRGLPLDLGKSRVRPMYTAQADDLVTYGGFPQFASPQRGEKLYINTEREDGRTTYLAEPDIDEASRMFAWPSPTQPGESGSPVLVIRNDVPVLVGLAGRWVKNSPSDQTEYAVLYRKPDIVEDYYSAFITHPGSGKTWRQIPDQVRKAMIERKGRILVSGPTRVVCAEIAKALEHEGIQNGLNISGMANSSRPSAQVQVAAHHTMLQLLTTSSSLVHGAKTLIIDEAHFDDSATIMLRRYAKYLCDQGIYVVEMSATLDGKFSDQSNYPIDDREIAENESVDIIRVHLEKGHRVLVFVPGIKSKETAMLSKKFGEFGVIKLSRDTFKEAMMEIKNEDMRLILSTDIAECGINIPGLDVVVDLGKKYDFYYDAGVYGGMTSGCSIASRVQRRGRVGRSKQGICYQVPRPPNTMMTSAQMDASILMTGRSWASEVENQIGIVLTDKQFDLAMREGRPPTEVFLKYDGNGQLRRQDMMTDALKDWKSGLVHYNGCGRCKKCETNCKWYDERLHDWLTKGEDTKKIISI